jgi:hypothetical protein
VKAELFIDGYPYGITTSDPELLARWLVEVFSNVDWTPATLAEIRVTPTWGRVDGKLPARPDWICDTRILGERAQVRTPREFAEALLSQIHRYEQLAAAESAHAAAESDPP